jgi:hypothetical protein
MLDSVEVRYDGADADRHAIAATELAESLQGFARIFGTVYHFAQTGEFVTKAPAQNVKVYVAAPEAKCYNVLFELWELAKQQQIFQGLVGNVALAVVTYIVAKAADRHSEMKHLAAALQTALAQNGQRDQAVIDKLLSTVDRMADALRPAARQAVAPIGESCATVRIGGAGGITLDRSDKERILSQADAVVTDERKWTGVLVELDRERATGRVRLDGDSESRVAVTITDPAFATKSSPYLAAFVSGAHLTMIGKAELSEGEIKRLFISNAD